MSQQLLHRADVGASLEQVCGEGEAQRVDPLPLLKMTTGQTKATYITRKGKPSDKGMRVPCSKRAKTPSTHDGRASTC